MNSKYVKLIIILLIVLGIIILLINVFSKKNTDNNIENDRKLNYYGDYQIVRNDEIGEYTVVDVNNEIVYQTYVEEDAEDWAENANTYIDLINHGIDPEEYRQNNHRDNDEFGEIVTE